MPLPSVRLLLLSVTFEVSGLPDVSFKLFVDGTTVSAKDRFPHHVAHREVIATDLVVKHCRQLELVVSVGKSQVVASSTARRDAVATLSRSKVLQPANAAKQVGVPWAQA